MILYPDATIENSDWIKAVTKAREAQEDQGSPPEDEADFTFNESEHPRGQPENAGRFAEKTKKRSALSVIPEIEDAAKEKVAEAVRRLPPSLRKQVVRAYRFSMLSFDAGWQAVEAVSEHVPEGRRKQLASVLSIADLIGVKAVPIAAISAGVPAVAAGALSFVPCASLAYLAYRTARNPSAMLSKARRAVAGVAGLVKRAYGAEFASTETGALARLARLSGAWSDIDEFIATLATAIDAFGGSLDQAETALELLRREKARQEG